MYILDQKGIPWLMVTVGLVNELSRFLKWIYKNQQETFAFLINHIIYLMLSQYQDLLNKRRLERKMGSQ